MPRITIIAVLLSLAGCGAEDAAIEIDTASYSIDLARISVSGVSSGAYMAGQLHVAHSELFNGAALLAGGPYGCAEGSLQKGLGPCMKGGDLGLDSLLGFARDAAASGQIDPLENLADDRVWIFHGAGDSVLHVDTSTTAAAFYEQFLPGEALTVVTDIDVIHGFPTLASGAACDEFTSPYLNACDYDAAGALLSALHGPLRERTTAAGELRRIAQPGAGEAEMRSEAYLYVPSSCAGGASCGVHVALHGCLQSDEFVSDAFAVSAGYNEWAEANDLLVLYPQVASSKIAPVNPNGCWDWWGYTGGNYAVKNGPQIAVIKATLDALAGTSL